jgi:hypothetical protein
MAGKLQAGRAKAVGRSVVLGSGARATLAENGWIAGNLRSFTDLLAAQEEDGFRIRAYRNAADRIEAMDRSLREIHDAGGREGLIALPAIGEGIASAIAEMLTLGQWYQLDRQRGEAVPERLFRSLPGVGPILADRFASLFDAQTLEELEAVLQDPEMTVPGLDGRRRQAILAGLAKRLGPIRGTRRSVKAAVLPPVSFLLEADAVYRLKARAGELRLIAPRRSDPEGMAWLPVLHLRRGDWHLTLL